MMTMTVMMTGARARVSRASWGPYDQRRRASASAAVHRRARARGRVCFHVLVSVTVVVSGVVVVSSFEMKMFTIVMGGWSVVTSAAGV